MEAAGKPSPQDLVQEDVDVTLCIHEESVVVEGEVPDSQLSKTVLYIVGHTTRVSASEALRVQQ
jgi:hypothetical protein